MTNDTVDIEGILKRLVGNLVRHPDGLLAIDETLSQMSDTPSAHSWEISYLSDLAKNALEKHEAGR